MPARAKKKRPFIAVVGGGVAGDLGGFVASVYKRGVPYVQIPTTLLAQVDSSIGGKTAIDLPAAKNLIGAFYQPRLVLSDVSVLKSLPRREVTSGLAEIIKYGVIKDRQLFCRVEDGLGDLLSLNEKTLEGIISRCGSIKAGIVERDEFDRKGCRAILNYGHTIGHAIEAASGYGGRYSHGEAVALGMLVANAIAVKIGLLKEADADRIGSLIARAGLPTAIRGLSPKVIYESHLHDKKFEGRKNRFILPVSIGRVRVVEGVRRDVIEASIRERVAP
jgi:3-dehydroquinate synthase